MIAKRLMILSAIFLCSISLNHFSKADLLHVWLIGDYKAHDLEIQVQSCISDLEFLFKRNLAERELILNKFVGEASPESFIKFMNENKLKVRNEDSLFIYIISHGAFDKQKGSFLTLSNEVGYRDLLKSEIDKTIATINCRLKVSVIDNCNELERYTGAVPFAKGVPGSAPAMAIPDVTSPLFSYLFFGHKGEMNISTTDQEQLAVFPSRIDGLPNFKSLFVIQFEKLLSEGKLFGWEELFRYLRMNVAEQFESIFPEGFENPQNRGVIQKTQTLNLANNDFPVKIGNFNNYDTIARKFGFQKLYMNPVGGVFITEVMKNSVAANIARLERGDTITHVNGEVINDHNSLMNKINEIGPNGKVYLQGVNVRTGLPYGKLLLKLPGGLFNPLKGKLGVITTSNDAPSIKVGDIRQDSFVAFIKLDRGDTINKINGVSVNSIGEINSELAKIKENDLVVFEGLNVRNNKPYRVERIYSGF
jgi:hypothetical protein